MLKYKLIFDKNYYEIITLPAPSLFNIFSDMYLILPEAVCSDPTSNGQISVLQCHPWIGNADTHNTQKDL